MKKPRVIVFQHLAIEHPGIFRDYFNADGIEWDIVELDQGDSIPDLSLYDALWVMGGPMDVWQEEEYPWLIDEKLAIQHAINELQLPYVGICLGHQLLAAALGAEVGPADHAEVGVMPISLTDAGKSHPIFMGLSEHMHCLQWHSAEVKTVPKGFDVLAESEHCAIQALAKGNQVITMQYHQEILPVTVNEWSEISEYRESLEKAFGADAIESLNRVVDEHINNFNETAATIYKNWKLMTYS
ncbi:MAG: type 1 glutamine amidotransferase [Pseudomonadota bacterium]